MQGQTEELPCLPGVQDRLKRRRGIEAREVQRQAMEGADTEIVHRNARQHLTQATVHFRSSAFGKGDSQDLPAGHTALQHEMSYALRQGARLPCPWTSN